MAGYGNANYGNKKMLDAYMKKAKAEKDKRDEDEEKKKKVQKKPILNPTIAVAPLKGSPALAAKKVFKPTPPPAPIKPFTPPLTTGAMIQQQQLNYTKARVNNDYMGMRSANVAANNIRASTNRPLYSSAGGDNQYQLNQVKTLPVFKQKQATPAMIPVKVPKIQSSLKGADRANRDGLAVRRGYKNLIENSPSTRAYFGAREGILPISTKGMIADKYGGKSLDTLENSAAFKAGEIGGTVASFMIPYIGARGAVVEGLGKIPKFAKMGKLGQAVTSSVATDLAVGLPLNVNYAYNKQNLEGEDALKSIGINTAIDVGLGAGIELFIGKVLKSGKTIKSGEDLKNLTPPEQKEVMTELEKMAYESNIRKGKIKPDNGTIYGNSFNQPIAELPAPAKSVTGEEGKILEDFTNWRKENFGGAHGNMTAGDMRAMKELYEETTGINLDEALEWNRRKIAAVGTREAPYTVNPNEMAGTGATPSLGSTIQPLSQKNSRLTNQDLGNYMDTGTKEKVKRAKQKMALGESPILSDNISITQFIDDSISGSTRNVTKGYGKVGDRFVDDVKRMTNGEVDLSNKYLELNADNIKHSYDNHSSPKQDGDIPLQRSDYEKLTDYIDEYDEILEVVNTKNGVRIKLGKTINGHSIITEMVSDARNSVVFNNMWGIDTQKYIANKNKRNLRYQASDKAIQPNDSFLSAEKASFNNILQPEQNNVNDFLGTTKKNADSSKDSGVPLEKVDNPGIEDSYREFSDGFDSEALGGTGVGEWVKGIKSKGVGIWKDVTRNADSALSGEGREWFKKTFEDNFYKSKGKYTTRVKEKTDVLYEEVVRKRGIKKASKESAGIQWYGEGRKQIGEDGQGKALFKDYTLHDLRQDFGYVMPNGKKAWENITGSDAIMRKIYDDYVVEINQALKRIYPDVETVVAHMESNMVGKTKAEIKEIQREIDRYVTGKRLTPRQDYYHHFQELQNGFFSRLDNIMNSATNIDPRLVGISEHTQPKSKFMGALQHRAGEGGTADALGGMLEYIPQAEYKINIEPNIPMLRNMIKDLKDYTSGNANQFIDYLMKFTNDLAGKTNPIDRSIYNYLGDEKGRKMLNSLGGISNRIRANAVVGNVNTVLAQFFNMPNVVGYAKNPRDILSGVYTAAKASVGNGEAQSVLSKSDFLRERYLDRSMRRFDTGVMSDLNKFFSWTMELGDKAVADSAFITFYNQGIKKGLSDGDAVRFADEFTRKSVAGRGIGELPLEQKAKLTKLFAPFQVEVRNAYNVLSERVHKKDIGGILGIFTTTWLMNNVLEEATGRRIGFDPVDVINESVEEYRTGGQSKEKTVGSAASRMAGEAIANLPFGSYLGEGVTSALGWNDYDKQKFFGESDPTRFGTGNIAIQTLATPIGQAASGKNIDLLRPAMAVIPPFGGKQIERGIRGLQDMAVIPRETINSEDGISFKRQESPASYSNAGKLRFNMDATLENYIKAPLLGSFSTKEGKTYLDNREKPMGENQSAITEGLIKSGLKATDAERTVRDTYKTFSDYQKTVDDSRLTDIEKAYLLNITTKDDKTKSILAEGFGIPEKTIKKAKKLKKNDIAIETISTAKKETKPYLTSLGKTLVLVNKYPKEGEAIAKGLGYSKSSIKLSQNMAAEGITAKQYEAYRKIGDINKDGNIDVAEVHKLIDDDKSLTPLQRTYIMQALKNTPPIKEKKK